MSHRRNAQETSFRRKKGPWSLREREASKTAWGKGAGKGAGNSMGVLLLLESLPNPVMLKSHHVRTGMLLHSHHFEQTASDFSGTDGAFPPQNKNK